METSKNAAKKKDIKKPRSGKVTKGQIWKDLDERSAGNGEFTIRSLFTLHEVAYAKVRRHATNKITEIRVDRLLTGPYAYLGRTR